jgi:hypothetical protein
MLMVGELQGKGEIRAKLLKHLAPITITKIHRQIPFWGRLNFFEQDFIYIITPVFHGEEKGKFEFQRGEVAFLPGGSFMCFFLRRTKSQKSMNPLGQLDQQSLALLGQARRGDSLRISRIQVSAAANSSP